MALTDDQEQRLADILDTLMAARSKLSQWEQGFLDDQVKRYDQYKSAITLSPKQWGVLDRMLDKVR